MLKDYKKQMKGFTIIEVLIVLAIAGLIMLIVLLAIPTLQRNTRNTNRREDAGRIVSAVNNYVANNSGTPPDTTGWGTEGASIIADAGTLGQYFKGVTPTYTTANPSKAANSFDLETSNVATTAVTGDALVLEEDSLCAGATGGGTTVMTPAAGSTTSQAVLLYDLETSKGNYIWACTTVGG